MGLDLHLFSIPGKADFVIEKAKSNLSYAIDFDKILDVKTLRLHLKMIQKNSDVNTENRLEELIEDSIKVVYFYPNQNIENYNFYSRTRGYDTINYLLKHYLKDKNKIKVSEIFYSGIMIENDSQFVRFEYINQEKVNEIYNLLKCVEFDELIKYYNLEEMQNIVYKLIHPDKFVYLKEEFNELKRFYEEAEKLNAFVVVKIS
ncbi:MULTISPECIES: DUF1877 family protein [unclassified Flavobacterium]|uniref:DUF1877 family protein n=1 Tax=unclassified Flavobacterium TaxID=196869 RepID=UPI00070A7F68|nr:MULTISPECIES: DUF1877 family protein [unclassified Flavobacterium]KRD63136.1 hypothetical protein ASE40_04975 [Flavobacterium sp. Root935]